MIRKKQYIAAQIEVIRIESATVMIPGTMPTDPTGPSPLPPGHFVPGPGASYDPQGSVV